MALQKGVEQAPQPPEQLILPMVGNINRCSIGIKITSFLRCDFYSYAATVEGVAVIDSDLNDIKKLEAQDDEKKQCGFEPGLDRMARVLWFKPT